MPPTPAKGIGIDFGASACRLAVREGLVSRLVCTVEPEVGSESMKRLIGMQHEGNDLRAAALLRLAKEKAETMLGIGITGAMLTVPSCFNDRQRAAMKSCAESAGFESVGLADESLAAAVFHMERSQDRGRWLVYGLGKHVFSASVLDTADRVVPAASNGDIHLGMDDFDTRLAEVLLERQLVPRTLRKTSALELAVRCRMVLTFREEAIIQDLVDTEHVAFTLSRNEFDAAVRAQIDKTMDLTLDALNRAGLPPRSVDRVLLVGFSAGTAAIRLRLESMTAAPLITLPTDAVCRGAAMLSTGFGECYGPKSPGRSKPLVSSGTLAPQLRPQMEDRKVSDSQSVPAEKTHALEKARVAHQGGDTDAYRSFLEEALKDFAYVRCRDAAILEGQRGTPDAIRMLTHELENWRSPCREGEVVIRHKLADLYWKLAREYFRRCDQTPHPREKKEIWDRFRSSLKATLEYNDRHAEAIETKKALEAQSRAARSVAEAPQYRKGRR